MFGADDTMLYGSSKCNLMVILEKLDTRKPAYQVPGKKMGTRKKGAQERDTRGGRDSSHFSLVSSHAYRFFVHPLLSSACYAG